MIIDVHTRRHRSRQSGMSLIEVMVAAAIVGILAAIAIPNMIGMRGRTIQAEAKAGLSAIARSQKAFYAEKETYTDNLVELGWRPMGAPRYIMGFTSDKSGSGVNDSAELGVVHLGPTNVFGVLLTEGDLPQSDVDTNSFTAGAAGNIDNDSVLDQWTLNDVGQLINVTKDID